MLTWTIIILGTLVQQSTRPTTGPSDADTGGTQESGLKLIEQGNTLRELRVQEGDIVWVHYRGTLEDGTEFDTSLRVRPGSTRTPDPFRFRVGRDRVIQGWNDGLIGMQLGDKRRLIIPPALGYGEAGAPPTIPPNATLIFDVELVGLWRPTPENGQ